MSERIRVGLIGDYNREVTAHIAIPRSLAMAAPKAGYSVEGTWVETRDLDEDAGDQLADFDGLWCVPGSPYANMTGVLAAIRYARETRLPFLGTCGGYQHAIIEYAQNVLGYTQAGNVEVDANTPMPLIAPLSCALVEAEGEIRFEVNARIHKIYGTPSTAEKYRCRYGLNPSYMSIFEGSDMTISGFDREGEPRVIELQHHPFFIATAYQPERSALLGNSHPLITAYVIAMTQQSRVF